MLPTFSQIALVRSCLAAGLLPRVRDESGPAAKRGTAIHEYGAKASKVGKAAALKLVPAEYQADCEALDLDAINAFLGPGEVRCEVAYAYNPDTDECRQVGLNIGRAYTVNGANMAEEFCGALDYECLRPGELVVADLKNGRSAVDDWQLKAQAIAAARHHGVDKVTIAFARADESGTVSFEAVATLDAFDLDMIAGELRALKARLKRGVLEYRPTADNCKWCRSFSLCPTQTNLARAFTGQELATVDAAELTPVAAGQAWDKLVQAESLLKRVRAELEGYAERQPFETPSGATVRLVEQARDYVANAKVVQDVVRERYGDEAAKAAVELSTSKALVTKALKGTAGARDCESLFEAAKQRGGFRSKVTAKVTEVATPKALRAAK